MEKPITPFVRRCVDCKVEREFPLAKAAFVAFTYCENCEAYICDACINNHPHYCHIDKRIEQSACLIQ